MDTCKDKPNEEIEKVNKDIIKSEDILVEIQSLMRSPFQNELSKILSSSPDPEAIKTFANKYPDRWAQAVTIMSRLSGYNEKVEVVGDINLHLNIHHMSDMELDNKIVEAEVILKELEDGKTKKDKM